MEKENQEWEFDTFYLPEGQLDVLRPEAVKTHIALYFYLHNNFAPSLARDVFSCEFPTYDATRVQRQALQMPPKRRSMIEYTFTAYPQRRKRTYKEGLRVGAKKMKKAQEEAYAKAAPFIL